MSCGRAAMSFSVSLFSGVLPHGGMGMAMLDSFHRPARLRAIEMGYGLVIYWSEADSTYLAEVPELPGCLADGGTYEEAVANAQAVVCGWMETATSLGRPIPEPRGKRDFF